MQRPAVTARLRQELDQLQEGLPRSLLTFNELLALFVYLASDEACNLIKLGLTEGHSSVALMAADIDKANRQVRTCISTWTQVELGKNDMLGAGRVLKITASAYVCVFSYRAR